MSVIAPGWAGVLCFGTVWGKHFLQKKSDQNQPDMTVVAALPRMGGSHPVPSLSINPTERGGQQCIRGFLSLFLSLSLSHHRLMWRRSVFGSSRRDLRALAFHHTTDLLQPPSHGDDHHDGGHLPPPQGDNGHHHHLVMIIIR